ncbi:MAG: lamin tail domain-containing protein, partial [Phycisphaerae bacterium]|nr:lamin tail domain-containing protein [Phycisphaerae bacterium]
SKNDYMKFRIADNTILAPYGYAVFYESLHFNNTQNPGCLRPFAFSENGEACYVRSGLDARNQITGFYDEETFGASPTGVAFGRWQKSTGAYNFVAMSENTPGAANAYPKVGPIVISEIMYNPLQGAGFEGKEHEYVELHNISGSPVTLQEYDPVLQINVPWRFTDGIDYTFSPNTTIPAGGYLVVAKNLTAFAARHGVLPNVVGPYGGQLDNAGEKLELSMPGDTDDKGTRYYIRIDRVNYNDSADWPAAANGQGMSLTRISSTEYGNDIINWQAADPTPGR